jgi:predicted Zn-dependent protease
MRIRYILIFGLTLILTVLSCSKVPLTGRKQLNMLPESELMAMSVTTYKQFLNSSIVVKGKSDAASVDRVGRKIANAVESFLQKNGYADRIKDFQWEFNLVKDKQANAWAMPGGKVVFYSGILPITRNDIGLAVIMGHEVAHAVARHGNERMSQGLATQLGGVALGVALKDKPQQTQNLFLMAYGLGAQLGVALPYSRTHESEADRLGLIFMAMAGYDPHEAVSFWQRMQAQSGGQQPPEILSTHPSHETRIRNIRDVYMEEAMKYYRK